MNSIKPTADQQIKPQFITFERFGRFATLLGFIVDAMTLGSSVLAIASILLFATNQNEPTFLFSNVKITAYHALMIWVLGVYAYIGMLHTYWSKNRNRFTSSFWSFIWHDLILGFKEPFRLMPFVGAIVLLLWILDEGEMWGGFFTGIIILIFISVFGGMFIFDVYKPASNRKFMRDLDENWINWDKRVQTELQRKSFVCAYDFNDVIEVWKVREGDIEHMLARYALKHPKIAKYGTIYSEDQTKIGDNLLVSTRSLNNFKYIVI